MSDKKDKKYDKKHDCKKKEDKKDCKCCKINKGGIFIDLTIINKINYATHGGNAGNKSKAETGGQISGNKGKNANQGGQIAKNGGQNANQQGQISKTGGKNKLKNKADLMIGDDSDEQIEPALQVEQSELTEK